MWGKSAVIVAVLVGAVACGSSSAGSPAADVPQPTSDQTTTDPYIPPDPATTAPDVHAQFAAWLSGGGQDLLDSLSSDLTDVTNAGGAQDISGLSTACLTLRTDTSNAQDYDPMPDPGAQSNWSDALSSLADASSDCLAGTAGSDATLISKSGDELNAATTSLLAANQDIKNLS